MSVPKSNGKTVLITGVNGYIASVLADLLLQRGYSIRGTTRRRASTEALLNGPWASYRDRVKIFEVPDMTVRNAFDEATNGVDGIFHTASPVDFTLKHYDQMVLPAVKGSETLLASALKAGPQLRSVVVTSSTAAVVDPIDEPTYVFTEDNWAAEALKTATKDRDEGNETSAAVLYRASKTSAERAVWKFRNEHKPPFAITTINPSVVIGPPLMLPSSPGSLNETLRPIYAVFSGEAKIIGPNIGTGSFVDVRDVASMHVWAFENFSKADGERYLATQGFGPLQAVADILRSKYKGTSIGERIARGEPGKGYRGYNGKTGDVESVEWLDGTPRISGEKAERVMELKYINFPRSVVDTARAFEGFARDTAM